MGLSTLKSLLLSIVLAVVTTISVATPALSFPVLPSRQVIAQMPVKAQTEEPQSSQSPEIEQAPAPTLDRDVPAQTNAAPKSTPQSPTQVDRAAGPYDMEAIKAFDREVYGTE